MLICEDIGCIREEKPIFQHLGFCLQEGTLLLLKGPNGSGKTSLLKILCGLLQPESGRVLWHNEPVADNPAFKRDLMTIGHKGAVKLDYTVEENLTFWGRLYNTELLVPAALAFYDLGRFADVQAGQLSAGWQRRVALARLIVAPCKVWLLDEPTNFLDDEAVLLTASLIESRVTQGGIVVVASHIMTSAVAAHTLYMGDFTFPSTLEGSRREENSEAVFSREGRGAGVSSTPSISKIPPLPNPLPQGEREQ
jgi:heme exporter protein A